MTGVPELLIAFLHSKPLGLTSILARFHRPRLCFIHKNPRRPAPRSGGWGLVRRGWGKNRGRWGRPVEALFFTNLRVRN